jgi:phosphoglycerol transferase MdoB-like AlkP superfamily enzyme
MVGDHGVHLRGKALIPVDEYRVGALFYAPNILKPEKITRPTSQLDIAPTILGLLGGSYRTTFYGNDLFRCDEDAEYALMVYGKKRYGIISGSLLTIFEKVGDNYSYARDSSNKTWEEIKYSEEHGNMASFSAAILQTAEKLLQEKKYHMNMDKLTSF